MSAAVLRYPLPGDVDYMDWIYVWAECERQRHTMHDGSFEAEHVTYAELQQLLSCHLLLNRDKREQIYEACRRARDWGEA